jgi:PPOX class probable F420-dependent enzyme
VADSRHPHDRQLTKETTTMTGAAHRRATAEMTDQEIATFLEQGHTMIAASHGRDGTIHLAPMWYEMIDGRPAMWTYGRSQKALNLRRNPAITVVVEDGEVYQELRGVQLAGQAEIVDDPAEVLKVGMLIQRKYTPVSADAGDRDESAIADSLRRQAAKRVAILVNVRSTASWDHRKLGNRY